MPEITYDELVSGSLCFLDTKLAIRSCHRADG